MRRNVRRQSAFDHGEPIHRIETLPLLFFCMLIALLALLWATRTPTHALLIDLPMPIAVPPALAELQTHIVGTTAQGRPTLDGIELSHEQLAERLASISNTGAVGIIFEPADEAHYEDALHTLATVKAAGLADSRFCFGGIERNRNFSKDLRLRPLRLTTILEPESTFEPPEPSLPACNLLNMQVPMIE